MIQHVRGPLRQLPLRILYRASILAATRSREAAFLRAESPDASLSAPSAGASAHRPVPRHSHRAEARRGRQNPSWLAQLSGYGPCTPPPPPSISRPPATID